MNPSVQKALNDLAEKLIKIKEQNEPYQRKVRAKHKRMKIRLIGKGGGKHVAGPYTEKPSYERSKQAPSEYGR